MHDSKTLTVDAGFQNTHCCWGLSPDHRNMQGLTLRSLPVSGAHHHQTEAADTSSPWADRRNDTCNGILPSTIPSNRPSTILPAADAVQQDTGISDDFPGAGVCSGRSISWQEGDRYATCLLYKVPSLLPAYLCCFPADLCCFPAGDALLAKPCMSWRAGLLLSRGGESQH